MKKIKNITVATDLSKNARTAFNYAVALAADLQASVRLVNVYMEQAQVYVYPESPLSMPVLALMPPSETVKKEALTRLIRHAKDKSVTCEVYAGIESATDMLIDLSKNMEFLVMGAKGEKGMIANIMGSVSMSVSRKAFCPVLVVPEKGLYNGVKQILYATSDTSLKTQHLEKVLNLAKTLKAKVHFVHVSEDKTSFGISVIDTLMSAYDVPYATANLEFISERGAIDIYRGKNKIDLIAIATHHESLWERIFHSSFTQALESNTEVPIWVLHDEDKE
jgi:nucleotide-binding universal stress UspA family protein